MRKFEPVFDARIVEELNAGRTELGVMIVEASTALFICRRKSSLNPTHKFCCRLYRVTEGHFSCRRRT